MSRDDSESSENDSGDDFEEPGVPVKCLFCENTSETISSSIEHVKSGHDFDVESFLTRNVKSTYDIVKIVTFVRREKPGPERLAELGNSTRPWVSEEYLRPVDPSDPWLWTDFEFLNGVDNEEEDEDAASEAEPRYVNSENGVITLSKEHFDQLQKKNQELQRLLEEKQLQLERLCGFFKETERPHSDSEPAAGVTLRSDRPGDENYFGSYSCHEIHREMLSDIPRMEAFRRLFDEKELFRGKSVLDVGCGTGILSMMAASAGATKVVGVDDSDILYTAMEVVSSNGFDSVVRLVKSKVETLQLEEKFDFIVSEWMGYFLLFEGMFSSVIYARERFLKPDGLIFPRRCRIYLTGTSDHESRERRLCSEFYGYKMPALRRTALCEPSIETITSPEVVMTEPVLIYDIDVLTATQEDCFFSSDFTLVATKDGELTAVCGYFDSTFEPTASTLTTAPLEPPTHWKQTLFYLDSTLPMRLGDRVAGRISVEPTREGARSILVKLQINENRQTFSME